MFKRFPRNIIFTAILTIVCFSLKAQKINEPKATNTDWSKPYQPFRIAGNLYYVGTYDLACYLVVTTQGNILINTGLAASAAQIKDNIETLGFRFSDIKILLTTQVHYDHVGAMATIKKLTGAHMMVDEGDAAVLSDGGNSDYAMGGHGSLFQPVKADRLLHDHDTIRLGNMQLTMLHHPGHTKGSCSFLFTVKDEQRSYVVLIANLPTIITEKKFADVTTYPGMADDYAYTFTAMKNISFDMWLASHASQFNLHDKHKPGDPCNPAAFMDKESYVQQLNDLQQEYDKKR